MHVEYGSMWETATDIDEHDEDYGLRAWNHGALKALHPTNASLEPSSAAMNRSSTSPAAPLYSHPVRPALQRNSSRSGRSSGIS